MFPLKLLLASLALILAAAVAATAHPLVVGVLLVIATVSRLSHVSRFN